MRPENYDDFLKAMEALDKEMDELMEPDENGLDKPAQKQENVDQIEEK